MATNGNKVTICTSPQCNVISSNCAATRNSILVLAWPVYLPGHLQLPEAELKQLVTHCHFVSSSHRYTKSQKASNRDLEISWRASTIKTSGWGYCTVPTPAAARFYPLITWLESGVTALVPGKIKFGTCMLVQ